MPSPQPCQGTAVRVRVALATRLCQELCQQLFSWPCTVCFYRLSLRGGGFCRGMKSTPGAQPPAHMESHGNPGLTHRKWETETCSSLSLPERISLGAAVFQQFSFLPVLSQPDEIQGMTKEKSTPAGPGFLWD